MIKKKLGKGSAVMIYSANNEQGFKAQMLGNRKFVAIIGRYGGVVAGQNLAKSFMLEALSPRLWG
jgi:hypothetical protein